MLSLFSTCPKPLYLELLRWASFLSVVTHIGCFFRHRWGTALLITQRETQLLPAFVSQEETAGGGRGTGPHFPAPAPPRGLSKRQQSPREAGRMQARQEKELSDSEDSSLPEGIVRSAPSLILSFVRIQGKPATFF